MRLKMHWIRHRWWSRTAVIKQPHGVVQCRCIWWLRLWYLVTLR